MGVDAAAKITRIDLRYTAGGDLHQANVDQQDNPPALASGDLPKQARRELAWEAARKLREAAEVLEGETLTVGHGQGTGGRRDTLAPVDQGEE